MILCDASVAPLFLSVSSRASSHSTIKNHPYLSYTMARKSKQKRHLNAARHINKQRWEERMKVDKLPGDEAIVFPSEMELELEDHSSEFGITETRTRAAVHWDDSDLDSESEEEFEMTEDEDNAELDGNQHCNYL